MTHYYISVEEKGELACVESKDFFNTRRNSAGFGGRLGYNLNANVALEAEVNFFPRADSFDQPQAFNNGHFIEALFGVSVLTIASQGLALKVDPASWVRNPDSSG
jgi:hypothetical protein